MAYEKAIERNPEDAGAYKNLVLPILEEATMKGR